MDLPVPERQSPARRSEFILVVVLLITAGTLVHPYRAQQASRYALTAAVVERNTVILDDYEHVLGIDKAVWNGHLYSDKAPGQPFFAVPFFAAGKAVGIEEATKLRIDENLGLWWVTLWSSTVMAGILAVMVYRRTLAVAESSALSATLAVMFGTMLLPFSALLFGHVMAAALLFGAYYVMESRTGFGWAALAGLLAGAAVVVEYTAVLGVLALGGLVVWRHRGRWWGFAIGGVPAVGALAAYNTVAFGSWHRLSYQLNTFSGVQEQPDQVFGMFSSPAWNNIGALFFNGRGLVVATPIVVVAVIAAIMRLRRRREPDAVMAVALFLLFALLPIFWGNPWGGDSPGPRYMVPMLPFLAVPLAWAWERWRLLTGAAILVSVVTMVAATLTDPLLSRFEVGGLSVWLGDLAAGRVAPTVFTVALGSGGWLVHMGVVVCLLVVVRTIRFGTSGSSITAAS